MTSVRDHLKPDGAFAMYNYYRETWLIDRLAGTAADVFGHAPCVDTFGGAQAVISVGDDPGGPDVRDRPGQPLAAPWSSPRDRRRAVPLLQGRLVPAALHGHPARHPADVADRGARPRRAAARDAARTPTCSSWAPPSCCWRPRTSRRSRCCSAPRGSSTRSSSPACCVVVLAAVETTRRFRTPPLPVVFAGIAASLALAWVGPARVAARLPFAPRLRGRDPASRSCRSTSPTSRSPSGSRESSDSQSAFAINLLGAIVGGCLEYAALVTGYNNLLLVTGLLYLVAFLLIPRGAVAARADGRSNSAWSDGVVLKPRARCRWSRSGCPGEQHDAGPLLHVQGWASSGATSSTEGRWLLSTVAVQTLGRGLTLPFTIIYLHEVRGISLDLVGHADGVHRRRGARRHRARRRADRPDRRAPDAAVLDHLPAGRLRDPRLRHHARRRRWSLRRSSASTSASRGRPSTR